VIADRLARSVPITYAARSKAERGYALSADEADKPLVPVRSTSIPRYRLQTHFRQLHCPVLIMPQVMRERSVWGIRREFTRCGLACAGYGRRYRYSSTCCVVQKPKLSKPSSNG
jgi:hypothetical protein